MRYYVTLLACTGLLCAALGMPSSALAHRVNIFAYVEQADIVVECSFSKSSKVKNGTLEVRDAVTGEVLTRVTTDANGMCRLPVPEKARKAGHGVTLRIIAGEGHQNDWTVEADELAAAAPAAAQTAAPAAAAAEPTSSSATPVPAAAAMSGASHTAQTAPTPSSTASAQRSEHDTGAQPAASGASPAVVPSGVAPQAAPAAMLTRADVESIVNRALDSRLSPITRMLAASVESGPTLRDIIGGLGWLLGLCGIAAYFRSRKRHV